MATHNGHSEDQLCGCFADAVRDSGAFREWLLGRTKFSGYRQAARLLDAEQMGLRPRKQWWRHWWSFVPELERERETDVFMVFDAPDGLRFALHFEMKLGSGSFQVGQPEGYGPGARFMANKAEYMNYSDYQTGLVCTRDFRDRYPNQVRYFDLSLTYDELAQHLPEFTEA